MDKITTIKIKYDDGTYPDEIPISVLSENVEWDSTHTLVDVLGSIDVDVTGTIQDQISQLFNEKVSISDMDDRVTAPVTSVNGQTGAVVLTASDVNALPSSTVIPTVPTNVSAFNNDAGYLTSHQSLSGYATEQWVGQQGYLTQHQDISGLQTKAITDTGGYFTTDTVEGALQEIGAEIAGVNTLIGTGVIS